MKTIETFKYLRPFLKRKIKQYKDYQTFQVGYTNDDFVHNRERYVFSREVDMIKEYVQIIVFKDPKNNCYKHIEL